VVLVGGGAVELALALAADAGVETPIERPALGVG